MTSCIKNISTKPPPPLQHEPATVEAEIWSVNNFIQLLGRKTEKHSGRIFLRLCCALLSISFSLSASLCHCPSFSLPPPPPPIHTHSLSQCCLHLQGFEKSRVKFLQDIGELEAEKRSQERINQFRYGTPKSSAKPQNAASSVQERLSFTQFVPDRRTFPSDGIPRAPILSALPSSTRHSRRSSGAARKRNY